MAGAEPGRNIGAGGDGQLNRGDQPPQRRQVARACLRRLAQRGRCHHDAYL